MSRPGRRSRRQSRRVVFVGDTHCGGRRGLWPARRLPPHRPWTGARYLLECWEHLQERLGRRGGLLVVMGDVIEGTNRKAKATGLHTATLGEQVEGAIEVWKPLADLFDQVWRVQGTPYHEDFHESLNHFDEALGVSQVRQVFNVDLGEHPVEDGRRLVLRAAHHPPGGAVLYTGTKVDRALLWSTIQAAGGKVADATWHVWGHLHEASIFARKGKWAALNPCWKLADFHALKQDHDRFQPDLGCTVLLPDEAGLDPTGWRLVQYEYPTPTEGPTEVLEYPAAAAVG